MNKYPENNSLGLGRVANIESNLGKIEADNLLDRVNELYIRPLQYLNIQGAVTIDFSKYRTWHLTLVNNAVISIKGLSLYKEAYIIVDPKSFTCTINGVMKESTESTIPYNHTLYKFHSPYFGVCELIEKTENAYGVRSGEFTSNEFEGLEFLI